MFQFPLKSVKISANETITIGAMVSGFGSGVGVVCLVTVLQLIAASKTFGRINRYKVNVSQEIIALGLGNVFGSFFKAIPLTASFARSAVSNSSGSKTPFTGIALNIISLFIKTHLYSFFHVFIASIIYLIINSIIIHSLDTIVSEPIKFVSSLIHEVLCKNLVESSELHFFQCSYDTCVIFF